MASVIDISDTKQRPCRHPGCGEVQTVPLRAKDGAVRCAVHDKRLVSNPFAEGLSFEELRRRVEGRTVALKRRVGSIEFEEEFGVNVLSDLQRKGERIVVKVVAAGGGFRWFDATEVEAVR